LSVIVPREPFVAGPVAKVSWQVSVSEPVRVTRIGVSSGVVTAFGSAAGGQLIVTVTVAGAEVEDPSLTVKVKEPWVGLHAPDVGVKMTVAESVSGLPGAQALFVRGLRVPFVAGPVAKVSSQSWKSAPVSVISAGVFWFVVTAWGLAVGSLEATRMTFFGTVPVLFACCAGASSPPPVSWWSTVIETRTG
jgi:hypothetical protein